MRKFWINTAIRAAATALVVGLPPLVSVWSGGNLGTMTDYKVAIAFALGGVGSLVISLATTFVGDGKSSTFTE
jgi:hypothetical protein